MTASSINLLGNSSDDPNDPNYDNQEGEGGLEQCEEKIDDLEQRVSAIEQKIGLGSGTPKAPASPMGQSSSMPDASGKAASPFYGG